VEAAAVLAAAAAAAAAEVSVAAEAAGATNIWYSDIQNISQNLFHRKFRGLLVWLFASLRSQTNLSFQLTLSPFTAILSPKK
jgi:hypothetical protein